MSYYSLYLFIFSKLSLGQMLSTGMCSISQASTGYEPMTSCDTGAVK